MSICNENENNNCDVCYEVSRADTDLTFIYGLTPSTQYYLWVVDSMNASYKVLITSGVDGSFTIDPTNAAYPGNLFNKYAGDFEISISTDVDGENIVPLTVYATNYNCVVLTISESTGTGCTPTKPGCEPAFVTDSDGSTIFEVPSGDAGTCTPCIVQSGIEYARPQKNGQLTQYRVGDAKWREDNMPYAAAPTNPLYRQELVDFFTLKYDNAFGNRLRFTDINGNATVTDNPIDVPIISYRYIIDNYTGLAIDFNATSIPNNIDWNTAIDDCLSHSAHGFDDYYLPNTNELHSLINYEGNLYNINMVFTGGGRNQWSSNTWKAVNTNAGIVSTQLVSSNSLKTTANRNYIPIRQHF